MPHLDAKALTSDDPKGLEFLASVLDVPADHPQPGWTAGRDVPVKTGPVRVVMRRRKLKASLAEPA